MVSKVSSTQDGESVTPKTPIVVRQQVSGNQSNMIVKSVANKTVTSGTPQQRSVVLNSGQVLGK